jgi:hypothetical protein
MIKEEEFEDEEDDDDYELEDDEEEEKEGRTMISVQRKTQTRLRRLGKMGDSYDSVINRLIRDNKKFKKQIKELKGI